MPDLAAWLEGDDLDRALMTFSAREKVLAGMRETVRLCRRDFYDPADETDWSVPNMERHLAAVEVAFGEGSGEQATIALAKFLEAVPAQNG